MGRGVVSSTADPDDLDTRLSSVAALADPVRRALYRYVIAQPQPVSREQAAANTGLALHVAKFHLDKLAANGLLESEYRRPPGRVGPGAGRPTKWYRRSEREIVVTLPARRYDIAGQVMAEAITIAVASDAPLADALRQAAHDVGRRLGREVERVTGRPNGEEPVTEAVREMLVANGFEPRIEGGLITLANCPFDGLARDFPELICKMNLDLIEALVESVGGSRLVADLNPVPGRCCVTLGCRAWAS